MFSEISLNSILKDGNLHWREKAIFKIFFDDDNDDDDGDGDDDAKVWTYVFYEQNSNNNLLEKALTRFVALPLSQHMAKETSFMTGILERYVWAWFLSNS